MLTTENPVERRLDHLIWTVIATVSMIVLAAPFVSNFYIDVNSFAGPAAACLTLTAAAWFYRRWRRDPKLCAGLESTAQVVAFTAVGAPLSYLAAAADFPLHDHAFDAIDRALGLDWMALLAWMNAQSALHPAFALAYMSFPVQATLTVLALAFTGRFRHLKIFMLAFMGAALLCIAISAVLPAEGVWGFYKLTAHEYPAIIPATRELHLPLFHGLRDGSVRMLTGMSSEGIITFPSFHAALGALFIVALWPVPVLRWISAVVNGLMIIATPVDGGHYFIDVFAGLGITILCVWADRAVVDRAESEYTAAAHSRRKIAPLVAGE
jgi:membrane-associated phospholipid phosphatase